MKTKQLKVHVLTVALIFLVSGACWADNRKNNRYRHAQHKQIRTNHVRVAESQKPVRYHDRSNRRQHQLNHPPAHLVRQPKFKYDHKYRRPADKHRPYSHKWNHKHRRHYKHKKSYRVFSFGASMCDPGWTIRIVTRRR